MDWSLNLYLTAVAIIGIVELLLIVSEWQIFKKAGEKGWKSLIPFYSIYLSHHIAGMSHIWFILEMIIWIFETFIAVWFEFPMWFEICTLSFTLLFTIASEIVHINKLCNCFGKGKAFKIGLFFIPFVFQMILAFGPAKYKKP